jgi:ribosomal protein L29
MTKKISFIEKDAKELETLLAEKREELRTVRFAVAGSRPKDPSRAGKIRKDIARIMTVQTQKETTE